MTTMFADFKLIPVLVLFTMPGFLVAQCPPNISVISENLILVYQSPNVPGNLNSIDTDLPNAVYTNVDVTDVLDTWQTLSEDFTGISLTGEITIHYDAGNPSVCAYINGIYNDPLPVNLTSFTGKLTNDYIHLYWITESEKNNAGFEIEQSFDGERFSIIGMVDGNGDSATPQEYNFLDPGVRNRALSSTAYYRIAQIDFDGTKTYTEVLAIDLELDFEKFEITKITGWDSPERKIQVYFYNPFNIRKIIFLLTDINGRIIEKRSIYPETGLNTFEIDLSNQKSPFYFLSLNNGKEIIAEKVALSSDF
jgi:hypothetical protein